MTDDQWKTLLEAAAEAGAKKALASVGLHDERAADDVRELRDWLGNVRTLKSEFVRAIGRAIGMSLVGALAVAATMWVKVGGTVR